ncbi:hypothetical protein [Terrisporobacter mayombei]|uniref:Prophage tail endopeptidase domain-containing protein n=1 Tax=Terrisporobacter mayombei TaxID=1541 RepID=A0ABY9Q7V7_9FIRM|nr:hypothetical protein [Terrisporobacter mayombei]WMT83289.1 hypothetical protein TEMA_38000 [Terrisporobacter mayombei]
MINLVYINKIHALPQGVDRVEIGNWTKTREINEIKEDEKKLNSEDFKNIKNINFDDTLNPLEIFTNLYTPGDKSMRTVNIVNSFKPEDESKIKGNKVLRTRVRTFEPIYSFNYNTIQTWLESSVSPIWKEGYLESKIITWPCYVEVLKYELTGEAPIEWRMLEGEFKLNKEQLELIKSKKVQPVIGIKSKEDCHLILPFCDLLNVFINGEITDINYRASSESYKYKIDKTIGNYNLTNTAEHSKYCNKEEDNILSQHTRNRHIDCNILKPTTSDNYYKMVGDISQYIKSGVRDYKISLLIGQLGRMGEDVLNYNGGTSQISLFLIENPQFKFKIKPYLLNEDNEKEYIDSDYKFSYNEKVLFDVEIINESSAYDYNNLDIRMDLIKEIKEGGAKVSDVLQINKSDAKYKGINIKDSVSLYLNDEKSPCSIAKLSNLNKGDKLTISSYKFAYTVTEYNALKEKIDYDCILQLNYLNNHTLYKYTNTSRLQVKPLEGRLIVTVNGDMENYFYLKLNGETNSSNIKVKSNKQYTICNLDYDKTYELSLINSSSYKPVSNQNFVLKNAPGLNTKSIIINTNVKSNNYFTQRKIDEIIINR